MQAHVFNKQGVTLSMHMAPCERTMQRQTYYALSVNGEQKWTENSKTILPCFSRLSKIDMLRQWKTSRQALHIKHTMTKQSPLQTQTLDKPNA